MTAKDSANKVLCNIAATGATAAWNIANFVMDGCQLTHAEANLQKFWNLTDGAKPLYASFAGPVLNRRFASAGFATTQIRRLPKEHANQINKEYCKTDPRTNKRAKFAKLVVSKTATVCANRTKTKQVSKFDDVLDGGRRDHDERTLRDFNESDD